MKESKNNEVLTLMHWRGAQPNNIDYDLKKEYPRDKLSSIVDHLLEKGYAVMILPGDVTTVAIDNPKYRFKQL